MTFFEHMYGVSQSTNVSKDIGFYLDQLFSLDWGINSWLELSRIGKKLASFELVSINR